jgi:double-stranded uracil-DNA glycosylase
LNPIGGCGLKTLGCDNVPHMRKFGLDPVVDEHTEILILGTLPSDESLSKGQYYAKPSNDFWKLLQAVLNERLTGVNHEHLR